MANTFNAITTGAGGIATTGDSSGAFSFTKDGGSAEVYIDSSGNVGIGTNSPGSTGKFVVDFVGDGSKFASFLSTSVGVQSYGAYATSHVRMTYPAVADWDLLANSGGALTISKNATERMRIGSTGNVAIGSTDTTAYKLFLYDSVDRTEATSQLSISGNGYSAFHWMNATAYYIGQNSAYRELRMYSGATPTTGVKLTNGATSWVSTSDENLKDIIEPIENAAEKVSTLRAVIGKYKDDEEGTRRPFLIAQDVEKVLPEAIHLGSDETLNLAYTETIPLLVAAIKEQQELIKQLQADVAALKGTK